MRRALGRADAAVDTSPAGGVASEVNRPPVGPAGAVSRRRVALRVHLGSLALLGCYLVWTARGMRFVYDDWSFVVPLTRGQPSVSWFLEPHNEHWVLVPKAVYAGLNSLFGFGTVWPYLLVTLSLHLLLCHLLWRMAVRSGSDPWLASLGVVVFAVYAAGVENILWAFQIGLVGNMVLGTLTMLELGRPRPRAVVVAVLCLLNVATSGIALVFLVLASVQMVWQRRPTMLWALAPASAVYALWYLLFSPHMSRPPTGLSQAALLPVYWLLGVGNAVASVLPYRSAESAVSRVFTPLSALAALAAVGGLVAALVALRRRPALRPDVAVMVFFLGCPLFVLLTSVSRISMGLELSMASRYAYVATAFLLPASLCVLTLVTARRHRARTAALVAVGALALANVVSWWFVSDAWIAWSSVGTRVIAAGQQLLRSGAPVYDGASPNVAVAEFNPHDLLLDLPTPVDVTPADELTASLNMQVRFTPMAPPAEGTCEPARASLSMAFPLESATVVVDGSSMVTATLTDGRGHRSHLQLAPVAAGAYAVESLVDEGTLELRAMSGEPLLSLCST